MGSPTDDDQRVLYDENNTTPYLHIYDARLFTPPQGSTIGHNLPGLDRSIAIRSLTAGRLCLALSPSMIGSRLKHL